MTGIKIEVVETKRYVGADGVLFDTEQDAVWSIVKAKLSEIIADGGGSYYDFDTGEAAEELRRNKDDVIRWLSMI